MWLCWDDGWCMCLLSRYILVRLFVNYKCLLDGGLSQCKLLVVHIALLGVCYVG